MDRRVTLNISAFYSDIKNLQATTTAGTCSSRIVFNVPKARSEGIEAELFARPTANWDFGLSATFIDAKLTSSVVSTLPGGGLVVVGGLADGNRLPTAPKTQAVGSVGYTLPGLDRRTSSPTSPYSTSVRRSRSLKTNSRAGVRSAAPGIRMRRG